MQSTEIRLPGAGPQTATIAPGFLGGAHGRRARALLIAGDQPGSPGVSTAGAVEALAVIAQDLHTRFAGTGVEVATLRAAPTRQGVGEALARCLASTAGDDLLIVMYAGHGAEPTADRPAEAWLLSAGEVFSDIDLATALAALAPEVDVVVISACCYGEGFFIPGPGLAAVPARPPRPMICISAANVAGQVTLTKLVELAGDTVAAAAAGHSYGDLARSFAQRQFTGREFHLDARPPERLADRVLDTARRGPASDAADELAAAGTRTIHA
jgi:hypothetical protein